VCLGLAPVRDRMSGKPLARAHTHSLCVFSFARERARECVRMAVCVQVHLPRHAHKPWVAGVPSRDSPAIQS